MALKKTNLKSEAELEELLVHNPEQIEEGFRMLTSQRTKKDEGGRLDILGVDREGILTLVELKLNVDPEQFIQTLRYYDLILEQGIDWYSNAYKDKINDRSIKDAMPQIFLIASDFDEKMLLQIKYIRSDIKVRVFTYKAFEIDNRKEVVLNEISIPEVKAIEGKPWTLEDNINHIIDDNLKHYFKEAIQKIQNISVGVRVDAEGYGVKFWAENGKKVCQIDPKRKSIAIGYKTDTLQKWEWVGDITTLQQIDEIIEKKIKQAYLLMKKNK